MPSPFLGTLGTATCPTPLGRWPGAAGMCRPHQSYPAARQYVAGGNREAKDVLTPSFSTLIHTLKRNKIHWFLKKSSNRQKRNTISPSPRQPHSSTLHDFSLNAPLRHPLAPLGLLATYRSEGSSSLPPSPGAVKKNPTLISKAIAWGTFWVILFKAH